MFQSARIKLTTWYLLIIMAISLLFSGFIYTSVNNEFHRLEQIDDYIQSRIDQGLPIPRSLYNSHVDPEVISQARTRVIETLGVLNVLILLVSGGAGYFLAGRTLRPISEMVDELGRFVSDASHELRTPLTSLRSEIEVNLANRKLTLTDAKKVIESNLEEVVKLQTLSDNLLELTQYEKEQSYLKFASFSLTDVIEETAKMVQGIAKKRDVVITATVVPIIMGGSKAHIRELFTILLDNAIKYSSRNSEVSLSGRIVGNYAVIDVTDQGIGIDKEDLPRIFDRFYRADPSRSKVTDGLGLGLSIAKKIVDMHKGTISVKSKPNTGTTFTVHLPLNKSVVLRA
jgi:two-component system sensor histidine kinase CiaH